MLTRGRTTPAHTVLTTLFPSIFLQFLRNGDSAISGIEPGEGEMEAEARDRRVWGPHRWLGRHCPRTWAN